jgi:type IV pilus assembly protein PilA
MTKQTKVILIVSAVVVGGMFFVMILLILAAVAIPAMQATIRKGNEASAMASLRMINTAEQQYNMTYPDRGFACSLATLGGSAQSGPATADAAQLIQPDLASGHKSGYAFGLSCTKEKNQAISYKLTAVPDVVGHSGQLGYCTDESGQMSFDPKGGTNCTELLQ